MGTRNVQNGQLQKEIKIFAYAHAGEIKIWYIFVPNLGVIYPLGKKKLFRQD